MRAPSTGNEGSKTVSVDVSKPSPPPFEDVTPIFIKGNSDIVESSCILPAETMPEFPGGNQALIAFLSRHLKMPAEAKSRRITGNVFVNFLIDSTGEVQDVQVLKGIGYGCDEEALRVVRLMPNWKPGEQQGRPVPVRYLIPIRFVSK